MCGGVTETSLAWVGTTASTSLPTNNLSHTWWMGKLWMYVNMSDNTLTSLWQRCQNTIVCICQWEWHAHLHNICMCVQQHTWPSWPVKSRCLMMADDRRVFLFFSHLHTDTGNSTAHSLFHFPLERRAVLPLFLSFLGLKETLCENAF